MLEIELGHRMFVMKEIWFSDRPFDPEGLDSVTFHACKENVDLPGFRKEAFSTLLIDTTRPLEELWMGMRHSYRQNVKRAEREGLEIRVNESYDEFESINRRFRTDKELWEQPCTVDYLRKNGVLFTMRKDGQTLGGNFYLKDERNMYGKVFATRRLEVDEGAQSLIGLGTRLMTWEAIKFARENGVERFDLGGYYTGSEPDPQKEAINQYKIGYGGTIANVYTYAKDYTLRMKLARRYQRYKNIVYIRLKRPSSGTAL